MAAGEITLYPPTWITLHDLSEQPDAGALIDVARIGGLRRFETVARGGASGPMLLWHGDAAYDGVEDSDADAGGAASRHRLELASLPWVYTRSGIGPQRGGESSRRRRWAPTALLSIRNPS